MQFAQNFIFRVSILHGNQFAFELYNEFLKSSAEQSPKVEFLIHLKHSREVWDFVEQEGMEISNGYWKKAYADFYHLHLDEKLFALGKLTSHRRFITAIEQCAFIIDELQSEEIISLLQKAGREEADELGHLDGYRVNKIFKAIDERKDVDEQILTQLEWLYLPVFSSYGSTYKPKRLYHALESSPEFFMDVFKMVYMPGDSGLC